MREAAAAVRPAGDRDGHRRTNTLLVGGMESSALGQRPGELGALPVVIDDRQHLVVHEPADPFRCFCRPTWPAAGARAARAGPR